MIVSDHSLFNLSYEWKVAWDGYKIISGALSQVKMVLKQNL